MTRRSAPHATETASLEAVFSWAMHNSGMRRPLPNDTGVDDVELAFYEALQQGDVAALMDCWTDDEEPVCVHPGGPRLLGAPAIRESFAAMFAHGPIAVRFAVLHRATWGQTAVHSVVETVDLPTDDGVLQAVVAATNVYVRTPKGWRLAVHHASPGSRREPDPLAGHSTTLH